MSLLQVILHSLGHYRRLHLAVALGVMATTAVLSGALVVGDSVRESLRALALDRLGDIDQVLVAQDFFRVELADELAKTISHSKPLKKYAPPAAVILLRATVELPGQDEMARASNVSVIGCDSRFWNLDNHGLHLELAADEVAINQSLADQLGATVDDEVLLRVPLISEIPSDSPLGEKTDLVASKRLRIARIVAARGLGQFDMRPNQQATLCAFVERSVMQQVLDQPGRANAILVGGGQLDPSGATAEVSRRLTDALRPLPEDFGLAIRRIRIGDEAQPVNDYFDITSRRMMLPQPLLNAAAEQLNGVETQAVLIYLANTIRLAAGEKQVPYSMVAGLNATATLGPYKLEKDKPLADDEILLNSWAAQRLGAKPGDEVTLTYYAPESTHGQLETPDPAKFRLRAIIPLAAKEEPPTQANDPNLTPELAGVTDQESIEAWDLPFDLKEKIDQEDEDYWDDFRTTPKAFITLTAARKLWTSRFGDTTSLRIPAASFDSPESLFAKLALDPAKQGLSFLPIRRQAYEASAGTTPFEALFLGFSFFLIAAAVLLTLLLFRLGVQQRAREIGVLAASGFSLKRISRLLVGEGAVVACFGAAVGVALGVGYAWLMLAGLRTIWLAAISAPFLTLHAKPWTLFTGWLVGFLISVVTIAWSVRRIGKMSPRDLLAGSTGEEPAVLAGHSRRAPLLAIGALILAAIISVAAFNLDGEAQAGAFFGSGTLVLIAALALVWSQLRRSGRSAAALGLIGLAVRSGSRNPLRSTLTIGLVASASFLIVAISAFRLEPTEAGTGGFELVGQTDQPVIQDLASNTGRNELAFSDEDSELLAQSTIFSLRVRAGDDASCLNLYQSRQPRVLGLPAGLIERGGFAWAGIDSPSDVELQNPFLALNRKLAEKEIPVALDAATAMYSLKVGLGGSYTVDDPDAGPIRFRVVALLKNNLFQGDLLISESNFQRLYPRVAGYRFFLAEVPPGEKADQLTAAIQKSLETTLGERGMDVVRAEDRLAGFLAVQNTYLSTFQSLGALGLLLGTFGLATVQLRSVVERRGELALMRAAGFRLRRLARLVLIENTLLLLAGLGVGCAAAVVAVLPHLVFGGAGLPWKTLLAMLGAIAVVGLLAGMAAVRATLRLPLLDSLRHE